ncbi:MAG: hypothetical protein WCS86_03705 [Candidatus Paceibacterota bacterium]
MKNKIVLVFLFSFLIPLRFSSAITYTSSIGSQSNPIHVQIDQDPVQAWSNAWDKLRSIQYVSVCASIYKTIKSHSALGVNMADPYSVKSETSYLNYLYSSYQICVNHAAQTQTPVQHSGTLCNGKYWNACPVGNNFVCPSTGNAYCEIPKTNEPTLPPGCDSTLNYSSTTGISCDGKNRCGAGSQLNSIFNTNETRCVPISKTKTTTPVIKKVPEVKAIQNEVKENPVNITKPDPINLNQEVTTSTTEVKPKGFWTRLIGWLGF